MDKAKAWLENYWYHYKWVTIITAFFLVAGLICLVQCAGRETYDLYVLYTGEGFKGREQYDSMARACKNYMENDKSAVCVNSIVYVSDAMKELYEKETLYLNEGINQQSKADFFDLLYTGSFHFLLVDPELYRAIEKDKLLTPLSDMASDSAAYVSDDGYGIRLCDTELQKTFAVFADLPGETVLCFRQNVLMQQLSGGTSDESYQYQKKIFCRMVGID